jgi:hypothetical protein
MGYARSVQEEAAVDMRLETVVDIGGCWACCEDRWSRGGRRTGSLRKARPRGRVSP